MTENVGMLTSPPERRRLRSDLALAACLAAIAGASNAVALRAAGVFAANMTGNVSLVVDRASAGAWDIAGLFAAMVLAFVLGALACAGLGHAGGRRAWPHMNGARLLMEAAAMAGLGAVAAISGPEPHERLCLGLALLMGWQNALVTTISAARARSTHLSGILTDVGIDLASLAWSAGAVSAARERLLLGITTVTAFCVGAAGGAWGHSALGGGILIGIGGALAAMALWGNASPKGIGDRRERL